MVKGRVTDGRIDKRSGVTTEEIGLRRQQLSVQSEQNRDADERWVPVSDNIAPGSPDSNNEGMVPS